MPMMGDAIAIRHDLGETGIVSASTAFRNNLQTKGGSAGHRHEEGPSRLRIRIRTAVRYRCAFFWHMRR